MHNIPNGVFGRGEIVGACTAAVDRPSPKKVMIVGQNLMKFILTLAIMSFLAIVLLGFMPMDHISHHGMDDVLPPCPVASLLSFACYGGGLAMTVDHVSALQAFSNNTVPSAFIPLALIVVLGFWILAFYIKKHPLVFSFARFDRERLRSRASLSSRKILSWLSFFENSPSFA